MFSTKSYYGLLSSYQESYTLDERTLCPYTQGYLGAHPSVMGGWCAPACSHEASPWAWQWDEGIRTQEGQSTRYSYTAGISQPRIPPTYAADQALPAFSQVFGGPVFNTNKPEIICPRPIHPLPKWINMTGWEDDEDETTTREDEGRSDLTPDSERDDDQEEEEWSGEEDYDLPRRFVPSFIFSPDPEDLPTPFFEPSSGSRPSPFSLASLSPDAEDLPQPHFDSDPHPSVSVVNSRSNLPGLGWSLRSDSFESIVAPDPEDLPPPNFDTCDRFEVGGFKSPGPHDRHQDWIGDKGTRDHVGRDSWWEIVMGEGRKVSGAGRRRRRPHRAWER